MKRKPKITIVIPVFKVEKFIGECIKSIQQQTYTNFECLVVNDGTPDSSIEIAKQLVDGDGRFIILEQENRGVSAARNLGIINSSGDYLVFIDPDDYVLSNYLETVAELFSKNTCDAVAFNHYLLKDNKIYRENERYWIKKERAVNRSEALSYFLKGIIGLSSCTFAFDRKILSGLRFDPSLRIAEDALLNSNYLLKCNSILLSDQSFYVYRQDSGGVTKTSFSESKFKMAQAAFRQIENELLSHLSSSQHSTLYAFIFRHLLGHVLKVRSGDLKSHNFIYFFAVVEKLKVQDLDSWKHMFAYVYYLYLSKRYF